MKEKRVLIWGFEDCNGHCMSAVFEGLEAKGYTCAGFISRDRSRCGRFITPEGIFLVYHTSKFRNAAFDDIAVTSDWNDYLSIEEELVNEYDISPDAIHFFTWLVTVSPENGQSRASGRKVFDCVTFLNELDVLKLRFELLDPVVDHFVVSEFELTHQWDEKPLYFKEDHALFEKYAHKIIYVCPPHKKGIIRKKTFTAKTICQNGVILLTGRWRTIRETVFYRGFREGHRQRISYLSRMLMKYLILLP